MNFIKEIFENKGSELAHEQFKRFGKGNYTDRALINLKKSKKLSVKTSFEFSNFLCYLIAKEASSKINISGAIVAFRDFGKELDLQNEYSKRGKVYRADITEQEITKEKLSEIIEKFKFDFLLLKLRADNCNLSCKDSLPKPGGTLKDNFCSASFENVDITKEFAFDVKEDFSNLIIKHIYEITDLIIPKETEDDFAKARLLAKRKGKIIRILNLDGKEIKKEFNLLV
ncbi:MAG: hypothetical protein WC413_04215 [Candidatus Nanoarchaeia archaeon]